MSWTAHLDHRLVSNRTSVGHAPSARFTSSEPTSSRTDPHRGANGGMECYQSGIHSQADPTPWIRSMSGRSRECVQASGCGHTIYRFITRVVLNILDNNHDMVATVSTLSFAGTRGFALVAFRHAHDLGLPCWSLGTRIHLVPLHIVTQYVE